MEENEMSAEEIDVGARGVKFFLDNINYFSKYQEELFVDMKNDTGIVADNAFYTWMKEMIKVFPQQNDDLEGEFWIKYRRDNFDKLNEYYDAHHAEWEPKIILSLLNNDDQDTVQQHEAEQFLKALKNIEKIDKSYNLDVKNYVDSFEDEVGKEQAKQEKRAIAGLIITLIDISNEERYAAILSELNKDQYLISAMARIVTKRANKQKQISKAQDFGARRAELAAAKEAKRAKEAEAKRAKDAAAEAKGREELAAMRAETERLAAIHDAELQAKRKAAEEQMRAGQEQVAAKTAEILKELPVEKQAEVTAVLEAEKKRLAAEQQAKELIAQREREEKRVVEELRDAQELRDAVQNQQEKQKKDAATKKTIMDILNGKDGKVNSALKNLGYDEDMIDRRVLEKAIQNFIDGFQNIKASHYGKEFADFESEVYQKLLDGYTVKYGVKGKNEEAVKNEHDALQALLVSVLNNPEKRYDTVLEQLQKDEVLVAAMVRMVASVYEQNKPLTRMQIQKTQERAEAQRKEQEKIVQAAQAEAQRKEQERVQAEAAQRKAEELAAQAEAQERKQAQEKIPPGPGQKSVGKAESDDPLDNIINIIIESMDSDLKKRGYTSQEIETLKISPLANFIVTFEDIEGGKFTDEPYKTFFKPGELGNYIQKAIEDGVPQDQALKEMDAIQKLLIKLEDVEAGDPRDSELLSQLRKDPVLASALTRASTLLCVMQIPPKRPPKLKSEELDKQRENKEKAARVAEAIRLKAEGGSGPRLGAEKMREKQDAIEEAESRAELTKLVWRQEKQIENLKKLQPGIHLQNKDLKLPVFPISDKTAASEINALGQNTLEDLEARVKQNKEEITQLIERLQAVVLSEIKPVAEGAVKQVQTQTTLKPEVLTTKRTAQPVQQEVVEPTSVKQATTQKPVGPTVTTQVQQAAKSAAQTQVPPKVPSESVEKPKDTALPKPSQKVVEPTTISQKPVEKPKDTVVSEPSQHIEPKKVELAGKQEPQKADGKTQVISVKPVELKPQAVASTPSSVELPKKVDPQKVEEPKRKIPEKPVVVKPQATVASTPRVVQEEPTIISYPPAPQKRLSVVTKEEGKRSKELPKKRVLTLSAQEQETQALKAWDAKPHKPLTPAEMKEVDTVVDVIKHLQQANDDYVKKYTKENGKKQKQGLMWRSSQITANTENKFLYAEGRAEQLKDLEKMSDTGLVSAAELREELKKIIKEGLEQNKKDRGSFSTTGSVHKMLAKAEKELQKLEKLEPPSTGPQNDL